jgi:predicted metal-binding membrane protein
MVAVGPGRRPTDLAGAGLVARAAALAATLGLAAACWVVSVRQMRGMNMGTATPLGSFGFFIAVWTAMMAAMMLPGAAPATLKRAQAAGARTVPLFVGSYLAVWALAGVLVYAVDRPHGTLIAGVVTIAAGLYEFTPLKHHYRQRCRETTASGLGFGLCCIGSSAGLMAVLVALGIMSIPWMAVITIIVLAQKLLPPIPAVDMLLALAITGLGFLIVVMPASVPGLAPPM